VIQKKVFWLPAIPQKNDLVLLVLFGCCAATRTLAEIFHAIYACVNVLLNGHIKIFAHKYLPISHVFHCDNDRSGS